MISLRSRQGRQGRHAAIVTIEGALSLLPRLRKYLNAPALTFTLQVMVGACVPPVDVPYGWTDATTSTSSQPFSRRSMTQPIVSYGACRSFAIAIIRLTPAESGSARMM